MKKQKYEEDIKNFKEILLDSHPKPYKYISKNKLEEELKKISTNSLTDFTFSFMKLLAKFKDGHMEVIPSIDTLGSKTFPLEFKYIYDGYYLIKASKEYKQFLGQKLLSIV